MVTKSKDNKSAEQTKRRAKVAKLQLNKDTIQDLTAGQQKQIKGGQIVPGTPQGGSGAPTCSCQNCP